MFDIKVDEEYAVDRVIKFKVFDGVKKSGSVTLKCRVVDIAEAAKLKQAHDAVLKPFANDDEDGKEIGDQEADMAVELAGWMADLLPDIVVEWDLKINGEKAQITVENMGVLLNDGLRFWAIHADFIDFITEISDGRKKSVVDAERKNLIKSALSSRASG